jgi:hypothetical protein
VKAMSNSSMVMESLASEESRWQGASNVTSNYSLFGTKMSSSRMLASEESEALLPVPRAKPEHLHSPKRPHYQTRHTPPCYLVDYGIDVKFK